MAVRFPTVDDNLNLEPTVKVTDTSLPARLGATALNATILDQTAVIAARAVAGTRRRPPRPLTTPTTSAASFTGLIGILPDAKGKVFTNTGFSASQIGVSQDGVTFTWGVNLSGGSGIATGFITTPKGEALVSVQVRDNAGPGTLRRSTGFNPATMNATSWATVLTASKNAAHMDGRWCLTERSIAPLASPGAGAMYVCEYNGNLAWESLDDGITWAPIFDLQATLPGATHVHAIAYDRWDDRVWITVGDTAYARIYYVNREDINGLNTPWVALAGSNTSVWQAVTVIPLAAGVVFLSDASVSGVFAIARQGIRNYGALRVAVSLPGTGLIGAHARQVADDYPVYMTFYQSGTGQTPVIVATADGQNFSTVHTSASTVTSGPGIHSAVGPDLDGYLWATRNLTGAGELLRLTSP